MRIDDVPKCVVSIGLADEKDRYTGFRIVGSGFLLTYKNLGYLITAKHVASFIRAFTGGPADHTRFMIRLNHEDGMARNLEICDVEWTFHPDENVDLAVVAFDRGRAGTEYDYRYLPQDVLTAGSPFSDIGIGDTCYTVGLCQVLRGQTRNLPVIQTGSIALVPVGEKIPVRNWDDEAWLPSKLVEAYLVQFPGLIATGGAPVFGRRPISDGAARSRRDLFILGVLQAAWHAPSDVRAADRSGPIKMPSDIGVVIPMERIIEALELPALTEQRGKARRRTESVSAFE